MDEQIKDQTKTEEMPVAGDNNGASITLEWLPPVQSPRLKCWQANDFDTWRILANDILVSKPGIGSPLLASISRLDLCWRRLRDDYLNWFIPQGPLGTHAHVHYSTPEDKMIKEGKPCL